MKLTKKDKIAKYNAYVKKYHEYMALSLDELKQLYKSKRIRGTYLNALLDVASHKLKEESLKTQESNENTLPST